MNLKQDSAVKRRRIFLKKTLYSAPVILALGHLSPSIAYGADSSIIVDKAAAPVAQEPDAIPGAGSGSSQSSPSQSTAGGGEKPGGGAAGVQSADVKTIDENLSN